MTIKEIRELVDNTLEAKGFKRNFPVRLNGRFSRTYGAVRLRGNKIYAMEFSSKFVAQAPDDVMRETVLHECAHAIVDLRYPNESHMHDNVFNAVCDEIPAHVPVLFENLWWPGLRLTDVRNVKYFFERLHHKNVGIMLDTGHLMNTNVRLKNEAEGADYVCKVYEKLGECKALVRGVHLSCSLSGAYQRSLSHQVPEKLDIETVWRHIGNIDQHRPFQTEAAKSILDAIQPEYVVHEVGMDSMKDLFEQLQVQLKACKGV